MEMQTRYNFSEIFIVAFKPVFALYVVILTVDKNLRKICTNHVKETSDVYSDIC